MDSDPGGALRCAGAARLDTVAARVRELPEDSKAPAVAKAVRGAVGGSCETWVAGHVRAWMHVNPQAAARVVEALRPVMRAPEGVLVEILLAATADAGVRCRSVLNTCLALALGAPADQRGLLRVLKFAYAWIAVCSRRSQTTASSSLCLPLAAHRADIAHLAHAVDVLVVGADGTEEHLSAALDMMAAAVAPPRGGGIGFSVFSASTTSPGRKQWRQAVIDAVSHPSLRAAGSTPPDDHIAPARSPPAAPAPSDTVDSSNTVVDNVNRQREAWLSYFNEPCRPALDGDGGGDAVLDDDDAIAELLSCMFSGQLPRDHPVVAAPPSPTVRRELEHARLAALHLTRHGAHVHADPSAGAAAEANTDPLARVLALAEEYLLTPLREAPAGSASTDTEQPDTPPSERVLRPDTPAHILQLAASVVTRVDDCTAFIRAVWRGVLASLAHGVSKKLGRPVAAFVELLCTRRVAAEDRDVMCREMVETVREALAGGMVTAGNSARWAQGVQLWHLMLLSREDIPKAMAEEHDRVARGWDTAEIASPLEDLRPATAVPPPLHHPSLGSGGGAWRVQIPGDLMLSSPCIVPSQRIPEGFAPALFGLLDVCRDAAGSPATLLPAERQGLFNLLQGTAHLVWASSLPRAASRAASASTLCEHALLHHLLDADTPGLSELTAFIEAHCADDAGARDHHSIYTLHVALLLLQRIVERRARAGATTGRGGPAGGMPATDCELVFTAVDAALNSLKDVQARMTDRVLHFTPSGSATTELIQACARSGHGVRPAILRLLIQHYERVEDERDADAATTATATATPTTTPLAVSPAGAVIASPTSPPSPATMLSPPPRTAPAREGIGREGIGLSDVASGGSSAASPTTPDVPPACRKITALVNARTAVDELQASEWYAKLAGEVDRLGAVTPAPMEAVLRHTLARIACRPGQCALLYTAVSAMHTAFRTLFAVLSEEALVAPRVPAAPTVRWRLLRSVLTIHATLSDPALPGIGKGCLALTALDAAEALLHEPWRPTIDAICTAWRFRGTLAALGLAAAPGSPLDVVEGTLCEMAKWLATSKAGAPPTATLAPLTSLTQKPPAPRADTNGKAELWEAVWFAGVVAERAGAGVGCDASLAAPADAHAAWAATVAACTRVLLRTGRTPLAKQLLTFLSGALVHQRALETQREVLRGVLEVAPESLQALVCGRGIVDAAGAPTSTLGLPAPSGVCASESMKRWLSVLVSGDPDLRRLCRESLVAGLDTCAASQHSVAYLAACADLSAGGHEKALLDAVVRVLARAVAGNTAQWHMISVLSLVEFVKAALATVIRVDSKGWFTQAAAALAEALACLKFCNRALRGDTGKNGGAAAAAASSPRSKKKKPHNQVDLVAHAPIVHSYMEGYGCATRGVVAKNEFVMMHWYLCYSAYSTEQQGACSWCAEHCHRRMGYDVEYAGCIPAYCDTNGVVPRLEGDSGGAATTAVPSAGAPREGEEDATAGGCGVDNGGLSPCEAADPLVLALFHPPPSSTRHATSLPEDFALSPGDVADLTEIMKLLGVAVSAALPQAERALEIDAGEAGGRYGIFTPGSTWKAASAASAAPRVLDADHVSTIDSAIDARLEYDAMPHHQINLLQSRVLTRRAAAASLCGWVAFVDKSQCLLICSEGASFVPPSPGLRRAEPAGDLTVLARNTLRFKVVGMTAHPLNGQYLAVHGIHDVQVFVVSGGALTTQLSPQLSLSSLASSTHVIHCVWLPHAHSVLAVVTTKFVKVFDLSTDVYCPIHNYVLPAGEGDIAAAAFAQDASGVGDVTVFVLSGGGHLHHRVLVEDDAADGPVALTDVAPTPARVARGSAASLHYSAAMGVLCVAYANTEAYVARWDFGGRCLREVVPLPSSLWTINAWEECPDAPGVLACVTNDGAQIALIMFDQDKQRVILEAHEFDGPGSGVRVEGLAVTRHRGHPSGHASSSVDAATTTAVATPAGVQLTGSVGGGAAAASSAAAALAAARVGAVTVVVALESGTLHSYPLANPPTVTGVLLSEPHLADVELQRTAALTARPLPRAKPRRVVGSKPGGVGRGGDERDPLLSAHRESSTRDDSAREADPPAPPAEALLHGRALPRTAPFDVIPHTTLRAMSAFDARWGGAARSDFPSTVPLNVWEDLTPLGRWAWSITRGVGVSVEDKDKLADGSDATSVTITPLKNLSRAASELGVSPQASGLGGVLGGRSAATLSPIAPGISPCTTPPLSPLSRQHTTPPTSANVSPQRSPIIGDRTPGLTPSVLQLGAGVGDTRPAARFVVQASSDVAVCGIRVRLSCCMPKADPNAASPVKGTSAAAPAVPDERPLSPGSGPAASPSVRSGSLLGAPQQVTDDPMVVVRVGSHSRTLPADTTTRWLGFVLTQKEAIKTTKLGVEVSIATTGPEVQLRQVELFTTTQAAKADRYAEARVTAPEGGVAEKDATIHTVLQSALDCLRLCLVVDTAPTHALDDDILRLLWQSVIASARHTADSAAADVAAEQALAALHVLFAASKHDVQAYRRTRAVTLVKLLAASGMRGEHTPGGDGNMLVLAAAAASLDHRLACAKVLSRAERDGLRARLSADIDAAVCGQAPPSLPVTHDVHITALYNLALVDHLACETAGDDVESAVAVDMVTTGLASTSTAARTACVQVVRRALADASLPLVTFQRVVDRLVAMAALVPALPAGHQVPFYNCLLAAAARLGYPAAAAVLATPLQAQAEPPPGGTPDGDGLRRILAALLPEDVAYNTHVDGFGMSAETYMRVKAVALVAGASFAAAPGLRLLPAPKETHPSAPVMDILAEVLVAQDSVREWVEGLGLALLTAEAYDGGAHGAADTMLPAVPPPQEHTRPCVVEVVENSNITLPAPLPRDLVTCALAAGGGDDLKPLSDARTASAGTALVPCARHTSVAVLQLAYALFRSGALRRVDEWKVALDVALRKPVLEFLHADLKEFLVLLCGGSALECQDFRDTVGLRRSFEALESVMAAAGSTLSVPHLFKLHDALRGLTSIAVHSPDSWLRFCEERTKARSGDGGGGGVRDDPSVAGRLGTWLQDDCVPPELAAHALRLITLLCGAGVAGTAAGRGHTTSFVRVIAERYLLTGLSVDVLSDDRRLRAEDAVGDARAEAVLFLLHGVGRSAAGARVVFDAMMALFNNVATFGRWGAAALLAIARDMLPVMDGAEREQTATTLARRVATAAADSAARVLRHPRMPMYLAMDNYLGGGRSYALETGFVQDTAAPQQALIECTLGSLGADIKYAADTIFVRLANPVYLKRILLLISDGRLSKHPKTVEIWHSDTYAPDVRAVREPDFAWQLVGTIALGAPGGVVKGEVELPVAVATHALRLHFAAFHEPSAGLAETLTCPSCNQLVTDRHGQCMNCEYENAYQCRQCRNINHEQLDAFLCNECGWCRYGRIDWSLTCRPAAVPHILRDEADRTRALDLLHEQNGVAHGYALQLAELATAAGCLASQLAGGQAGSGGAGGSGDTAPRPPRLGPKDRMRDREAERSGTGGTSPSGGKGEDIDGVHPAAVALSSVFGAPTRDVAAQLAKSLRKQTALRKLLHTYTASGNTTSAGAADDPATPVGSARISARAANGAGIARDGGSDTVGDFVFPSHYGALVQVCVLCLECLTHMADAERGAVQAALMQPETADTLFDTALQGPESARSAARDVLLAAQRDCRGVTLIVARSCEALLVGGVQDPHNSVNPHHLTAAAALLSQSAVIEDPYWYLRVPAILRVFLLAVDSAMRCPGVMEYIAPAALACVALLATGRATALASHDMSASGAMKAILRVANGTADAGNGEEEEAAAGKKVREPQPKPTPHRLEEKYGRRWLAAWLLRRRDGELARLQGTSWLVDLLVAPHAACVAQAARVTLEELSADRTTHAGLLRVLTEHLPRAVAAGRSGGGACEGRSDTINYASDGRVGGGADSFFHLLTTLLEPLWARVLLAHKGFLPFLCRLVRRETEWLAGLEGSLHAALGGDGCIHVELGWSLMRLLDILSLFISTDAGSDAASADRPKASDTSFSGLASSLPRARSPEHHYFSKALKAHGNGLGLLLDASFTLKSLAAVRTKPVSSAEAQLRTLLDVLSESNADKASFLTSSVAYLAKPRLPCQMGKLILEKVLNVVDPKPPEVSCQLLLKKKPSQEDFIRGHMGNQPVVSTAVGKTMGDVATYICRHLDLQLDPDFGLELLVDSKIIDLSLPIQLVFDLVWRESPSSKLGSGPMVVVYRLQGLDGEATEERVETLQQPEVEEDDPALKFAVTECLAEGSGLRTLLAYVACVCGLIRSAEAKGVGVESADTLEWAILLDVLTLLHHCCHVKVNRVTLAQHDALQVFLAAVDICENKSADTAHHALQLLLSMAGCIAGELGANSRVDAERGGDNQHLEFCLQHLIDHFAGNRKQLTDAAAKISRHRIGRQGLPKPEHHLYDVLRLITVLTCSNAQAVPRVHAFFVDSALALTEDDPSGGSVLYSQSLAVVVSQLDAVAGGGLRQSLHDSGLTAKLIAVTRDRADGASESSLMAALALLDAMLQVEAPPPEGLLESLVDVVPQLHTLECRKERQDVAFAAALVLDALAKTGRDSGRVEKVRSRAKHKKHAAAMAKRKKVLKELDKALVAIDFDDEDDEGGLTCLVCRETATFRPADVLGIYMFARRVEIFTNTIPNDAECTFATLNPPSRVGCYSCVTHFNAIHHACHKEATEIDAALRPPKREWDGATVRNLKTRCNAILPIKVDGTSQAQYTRCCCSFIERVGGSRRRGQLRMYEQCVYDMRMMLSRICWGHSYSTDSSGGGAEHNFCALPFMLQLSLHALDTDGEEHDRRRAASLLEQFIAGAATPFLFHLETPPSPNITAEFIMYIVTSTLQLMSIAEWRANKYVIIRNWVAYLLSTFGGKTHRSKPVQVVYGDVSPPAAAAATATLTSMHTILSGLLHQGRLYDDDDDGEDAAEWVNLTGVADTRGGSTASGSTTSFVPRALNEEEGLFAFLRPFLTFIAVVDLLQEALKADDADADAPQAHYTGDAASSVWIKRLSTRLATKQVEVVERMKTLRQRVVDELLPVASLQEALDVLGVLPEVLREAPSEMEWCLQFLS